MPGRMTKDAKPGSTLSYKLSAGGFGGSVVDFIAEVEPSADPDLIVDLGTTTGNTAFALEQRFPRSKITGLDVSAPLLTFAARKAKMLGSKVEFVQANAENTGLPNGGVDILTGAALIHEMPKESLRNLFFEAKRVLSSNGMFVLSDGPTYLGVKKDLYSQFKLVTRDAAGEPFIEEGNLEVIENAIEDSGLCLHDYHLQKADSEGEAKKFMYGYYLLIAVKSCDK